MDGYLCESVFRRRTDRQRRASRFQGRRRARAKPERDRAADGGVEQRTATSGISRVGAAESSVGVVWLRGCAWQICVGRPRKGELEADSQRGGCWRRATMADGMDRAATTAGMSKRAATEEQAQGVGADIRGDELWTGADVRKN
jgi:hypothetical protein